MPTLAHIRLVRKQAYRSPPEGQAPGAPQQRPGQGHLARLVRVDDVLRAIASATPSYSHRAFVDEFLLRKERP